MNRQIDYQKLLYKLQGLADILPGINPEAALRLIKNTDTKPHYQLIRECRDFQDCLQRATEDCRDEVEKPSYIGVIGHYSHGKSSLLNALIFPPKTLAVLPIGEGVVTSLCTLVQFVSGASTNEFYEVEAGGLEKTLTPDGYQSRVSGRGDNLGALSHFRVRLAVPLLDDQLFQDFAAKRIELLDTPGLGGPYWKDEHALMRWIKEFETIVVCIKATEINETTAVTVNPFLKKSLKPCIPVVTFWDMWRTCADFKGISDEVKARAEAKKRITEFFGPIEQFVDDTVFVSSTSADLQQHRAAVRSTVEGLELIFIGMEDFTPTAQAPAELICAKVDGAKVYVGILGMRYGSLDEATGLSMTELEYRRARGTGKALRMFVMNKDAPITMGMVEEDPEGFARLIQLRKEVLKEHVCGMFSSVDDLARKVEASLRETFKR